MTIHPVGIVKRESVKPAQSRHRIGTEQRVLLARTVLPFGMRKQKNAKPAQAKPLIGTERNVLLVQIALLFGMKKQKHAKPAKAKPHIGTEQRVLPARTVNPFGMQRQKNAKPARTRHRIGTEQRVLIARTVLPFGTVLQKNAKLARARLHIGMEQHALPVRMIHLFGTVRQKNVKPARTRHLIGTEQHVLLVRMIRLYGIVLKESVRHVRIRHLFDPSTFTVDPNDPTRIIVPGELRLSGDIDLSECSLFVGNFVYSGGYQTLKVKNLISKGQIYMSGGPDLGIEATEDVIGNGFFELCNSDCNITANRIIGGTLNKCRSKLRANEIRYCYGYHNCKLCTYGNQDGDDPIETEDYVESETTPSIPPLPGGPGIRPLPPSSPGIHACYSPLPKKLEVCHMLCYDDTPRWDSETRECEACPAETPHWNGTECIACSDSKPVWNAETKECEACPSETPVWNGTRCVECVADSDCASNTDGRTMCDTDTNTCQEPEMMCPIGDYYEYATEAEAQWCVENCPEHFKKGNTCYSCYYMQHVAFPTHEEAQTCADSCKEIRGAKYETCTLCTDTYYRYWNVNNAEECTDICPGMRFVNVYTPENDGGTIPPIFVNYNNCDSCYLSGLHGSMAQFDIEDCSKICLNHVQVGSECISCDVTEGLDGKVITFESEALAQECAEKCNGKRYANGKDCISCLPATTISTDEEATECLKNCPNKFVTGNYCYSCDYGKHIHYTEKITFANNDEAQECANNCPEERFAHGSTCYSCYNIATYSFSTEEEAQACGKACGKKRHVEGNKCHFNLVPAMQTQTLIGGEETVPPLEE